MEEFFKPAIDKIKHLLQAQLKTANAEMPRGKSVRTIVLCGGFGDSKYLHRQLKDWCRAHGNLRLICPPHPQAAIVKGAALRGLGEIKPSRRKCRRFYGYECSLPSTLR